MSAQGDPEAYARRSTVNAHVSQWRRRGSERVVSDPRLFETAAPGDLSQSVVDAETVARLFRRLDRRSRAVALAVAGVAAAGVLITPLAANRLTPAPIPAAPVVGLKQCLATLTADDILPGNRQVETRGLRIVASVATRYVDGQPRSSASLVGNVDVQVTDGSTGETVLVDAAVSQLLWQAALPGNEAGDFLRHAELEEWIRGAIIEPAGNPTLVGASVFQQADMAITLQVRCGDSVRQLTATGTGNPSLPGETTAIVTWLECGPEARNGGLSDELAVFAESCDTTLTWPPVKR